MLRVTSIFFILLTLTLGVKSAQYTMAGEVQGTHKIQKENIEEKTSTEVKPQVPAKVKTSKSKSVKKTKTSSKDELKLENVHEGTLELGTILGASSEIADFIPSQRVAKVSADIITIGDDEYEVRLFFFEDINNKTSVSFYDFCEENGLLNSKSKIMDQGYGPIEFFSSVFDPQLKTKGIHYLKDCTKTGYG